MSQTLAQLRRLSQQRKLRPIRRIVQKSGTSCGVACVAMLARLSYRDAMRCGEEVFSKEEWEAGHRTLSYDLRRMLAELGWKLGYQVRCADWEKVPPDSLVAVQWKQQKGMEATWHWVICTEDAEGRFVLDPRATVKTVKRRELQRLRLAWYHRVTGR